MKISHYLGFGVSAILASSCGNNPAPEKPNIIYILADDLGYGDLGCYGQTFIKTPNIDRLAREGILLTEHYAGCTVSAPSRSSLITGLHTGHTPIRGNKENYPEGQYPQPRDTYTIGKMLQEGGYTTGCFGKWGLGYPGSEGAPENQGFDTFFGYNCQALAHNYYPYYLWNNRDTVWLKGNEGTAMNDYAPDIIQHQALEFIRNNKNKPFFAFLTYVLPHAELISPQDSILEMYSGKFEETPYVGVEADHPEYRKGGYGSSIQPRADFASMITRLDAYTGEIMVLLKELGLDKNTLVIFTSDNGPHIEGGADPAFFNSSGPLRGTKRDLNEGGIRVPFIARYPTKIKPGTVSDHVSASWDTMVTLAELTGTRAAENTDGISFLPTLTGEGEQKQHDFLYWEFHEQGGKMAVRKGRWKGIKVNVGNPDKSNIELYDLSNDLHEDNNIADQHPQIVAELNRIMGECHSPSQIWNFGRSETK